MKRILLIVFLFIRVSTAKAQIETPVKWSYAAKRTSPTEAILFIKATISDGWHIYSVNQGDGGPLKTSFKFTPSNAYNEIGKVKEPTPNTRFEKAFGIQVNYFSKSVIFQQRIKLKAKLTTVKGSLEYMVCNDHQCLPPTTVEFSIPIK